MTYKPLAVQSCIGNHQQQLLIAKHTKNRLVMRTKEDNYPCLAANNHSPFSHPLPSSLWRVTHWGRISFVYPQNGRWLRRIARLHGIFNPYGWSKPQKIHVTSLQKQTTVTTVQWPPSPWYLFGSVLVHRTPQVPKRQLFICTLQVCGAFEEPGTKSFFVLHMFVAYYL